MEEGDGGLELKKYGRRRERRAKERMSSMHVYSKHIKLLTFDAAN